MCLLCEKGLIYNAISDYKLNYFINIFPARDCQVGKWTAWSECSNSCGRGQKQRKRAIIQEAAFGGKPCPKFTRSKRVCYGDSGCRQQSVEYSREEQMGKDMFQYMLAMSGYL